MYKNTVLLIITLMVPFQIFANGESDPEVRGISYAEMISYNGIILGETHIDELRDSQFSISEERDSRGKKYYKLVSGDFEYTAWEDGVITRMELLARSGRDFPEIDEEIISVNSYFGDWVSFLQKSGLEFIAEPSPSRLMQKIGPYGSRKTPVYRVHDLARLEFLLKGENQLAVALRFNVYNPIVDRSPTDQLVEPYLITATVRNIDFLNYQWPYKTSEITTLPDEFRSVIGVSSILGQINHDQHEKLQVEYYRTESNREKSLEFLREVWGITSRETLFTKLQQLQAEGLSAEWRRIGELVGQVPTKDIWEIAKRNEFSTRDILRMYIYSDKVDALGERALMAFDLSRAAYIVRHAYQAMILEKEEAWDLAFDIAEPIFNNYAGWEDFASHYVIGRIFLRPEDFVEYGNKAINPAIRLLNTENSIWFNNEYWPVSSTPESPALALKDCVYIPDRDAVNFLMISEAWDKFSEEKFDEAETLLESSTLWMMGYPLAALDGGVMEFRRGNPDKSEEYLVKFTKAVPADSRGWYWLGQVQESLGRNEEAEASYENAVEAGGSSIEIRLVIFRSALKNGRLNKAGNDIQTDIKLLELEGETDTPRWYYVQLQMGYVYYLKGQFGEAVGYISEAYPYYENDPNVIFILGKSLVDTNPDQAAEYFPKAEKLGLELGDDIKTWLSERN